MYLQQADYVSLTLSSVALLLRLGPLHGLPPLNQMLGMGMMANATAAAGWFNGSNSRTNGRAG